MSDPIQRISPAIVRADFNDILAVVHYTRAAHELGLWESERILIERFFPDRAAPLVEAGCGAGRVTLGLWQLGFRRLTAFDFAEELVDQARSLACERGARAIRFLHADATNLGASPATDNAVCSGPSLPDESFAGALFMFNGLMQIPGRNQRRRALCELHRICIPGATLLFTTHDRDATPGESAHWRHEAQRWERGEQDPRLLEYGDRYFADEAGRTYMHLPDRLEILEDLAATGWAHTFDAMRAALAKERPAVISFSDDCRFWIARRS